MAKNKGGRPTKITEIVLQKLEVAFSQGFSDLEACLYADIGASTLYDYCKVHPAFSDRKEALKKKPLMKARININNAINKKDLDTSKWYLERKAKHEFSTKVEQDVKANVEKHIKITLDGDDMDD